jgi:hypothetical protein
MQVYYMLCILTHFWWSFVPKWGILKLLGDYRYLSIMKPQIIDKKKFSIKLQTLPVPDSETGLTSELPPKVNPLVDLVSVPPDFVVVEDPNENPEPPEPNFTGSGFELLPKTAPSKGFEEDPDPKDPLVFSPDSPVAADFVSISVRCFS